MPKLGPGAIIRNGLEKVTESSGIGKGLTFKRFGEKRFWERWSTEKYGQYKAAMGMAIGGQAPQMGPDILKFIKQHDPDNSSGAVKDSLEIMQKLQDKSTKAKDLFSSIQPLKNIIGGGLYGKMKAAGAAATAAEKVKQPKKKKEEEVLPEEEEEDLPPAEDIIALLIAAAMAMCEDDDKVEVAERLWPDEIEIISNAYYGNVEYVSHQRGMPTKFVESINFLIPIFRLKEGLEGALVS